MSTRVIMNRWQAYLQTHLSQLHAYQCRALAAFSLGAAYARHCHLSRLVAHVPSAAQPHSTRRRLLRLLGNPRLDVDVTCQQLAHWLRRWNSPTAQLRLLLDETPLRNDLRVLKVSVAYRRRALPLVWHCYTLKDREQPLPDTLKAVLEQASLAVQTYAPQAQVVVVADRGLCWPQLIRWCEQQGWCYLLRAQGQTRARRLVAASARGEISLAARGEISLAARGEISLAARGEISLAARGEVRLDELVQAPGEWWCGQAQLFKQAGWLTCSVIACWPPRTPTVWLLVTNLKPTLHCCRLYARRLWQEQSFRDEKSAGFHWHLSGVREPQRANRLLLVLALAQLWLLALGTLATQSRWRTRLGLQGRSTRRLWSCFRRGWHLLLWATQQHRAVPCSLSFAPP